MVRLLRSCCLSGVLALAGLFSSGLVASADDLLNEDRVKPAPVVDHQRLLAEGFRGIIDGDEAGRFVKSISSEIEQGKDQKEELQRESGLAKPNQHAALDQVDQVVTGSSNPTALYTKFNAAGEPIAHHQDYPRPTIRSLATSLFNSININPYPGTD